MRSCRFPRSFYARLLLLSLPLDTSSRTTTIYLPVVSKSTAQPGRISLSLSFPLSRLPWKRADNVILRVNASGQSRYPRAPNTNVREITQLDNLHGWFISKGSSLSAPGEDDQVWYIRGLINWNTRIVGPGSPRRFLGHYWIFSDFSVEGRRVDKIKPLLHVCTRCSRIGDTRW